MDVQTERYLEPLDRVEVLAGPTGRRKWPDHVKGQLVAESFLPGVRLPSVMGLSPIICQRGAGWHQDSAYDGINSIPSHGVILWCPLVDTDIDNGTLIVCPKSHTEPNHTNDIQNGSPGISRQIITPNDIVSKYKQLSIPVNAGDGIVSYANLIHKSGENVSSSIRYTLLVRFNIITKNDFFLFN